MRSMLKSLEMEGYGELIRRSFAWSSPAAFARYVGGKYDVPDHIAFLNRNLMSLARGDISRLAVFMPPRHGKSELVSRFFPAWYLGTHPDDRVILASYGSDFASQWGRKSRDLLVEYGELFGVQIDERSSAKNSWDLKGHRGGMNTGGVGSGLTGMGASLFIIDDPVKDAEHANSTRYRESAKDWYRSVAHTRLAPDGRVVLIQTKWHEDDLGSWIIRESNEDWTVINLPALAEKDDLLGRKPGEALWPERFNHNWLDRKRLEVGEYWFSALYQQRPQPLEGGVLKRGWLQYYNTSISHHDLQFFDVYMGVDLAISKKDSADYTTTCVIAVKRSSNTMYILDWTRDHLDFPEQLRLIQGQYNRWKPVLVGIESTAYQAALSQQLLTERAYPIRQLKPTTDKTTRFMSRFTLFENGHIFLPAWHSLLGDFESEFATFPSSKHDDLLDATEIALSMVGHAQMYTNSEEHAYYPPTARKYWKHKIPQYKKRL